MILTAPHILLMSRRQLIFHSKVEKYPNRRALILEKSRDICFSKCKSQSIVQKDSGEKTRPNEAIGLQMERRLIW